MGLVTTPVRLGRAAGKDANGLGEEARGVAFLIGHSCLTVPGFGFIPDPWQGPTPELLRL